MRRLTSLLVGLFVASAISLALAQGGMQPPGPIYGGIFISATDQPDTTAVAASTGAWTAVNWGDNNPATTTYNRSVGVTAAFATDSLTLNSAGAYMIIASFNMFTSNAAELNFGFSEDGCSTVENDGFVSQSTTAASLRRPLTMLHMEPGIPAGRVYSLCVRSRDANTETLTVEHGSWYALKIG
jgi:hypothetical protein